MGGGDVVLPAGEEHRGPGVALSARPAAQLIVQPFGAVPAGADDVQPAQFGDPLALGRVVPLGPAEPDVGSAPGHLGGHRHRVELAGLGDHPGLFLVVLGVEHDGGDAAAKQPGVQVLRLRDVLGADQDRLTGGVHLDDVVDDRVVLGVRGDVHPIGFVLPDVRRVGRDRRHAQGVELAQLLAGGQRGPGHPAHGRVAIDQRLDGDGVEHLAGLGGLDALLGLNGRLQAVGPALQGGDPAPGRVDQLDSAVADHVVHIALQQHLGV